MFAQSRDVELDDGRTLVVQFQGLRYGWGAFVPAGSEKPVSGAESPAAAIAQFLGYKPAWADRLSEDLLRELRDGPR